MPRARSGLLLAVAAAGCSEILDSSVNVPEEAEVTVTGSSPVPLRLVMSSRFLGTWNPEAGKYDISLNQADTVIVSSLPTKQTHRLNETGVFFVRLTNPDLEQTASIQMTVHIDGRQVFVQSANMRDASLEYVFFVE